MPLQRPVAIKVFRPVPGNDSPATIERFKLEGFAASQLNHPHIVSILDFGISEDGIAYLVMELLTGWSVARELRERGPFSLARIVDIILPVTQAVEHAHRNGILHRDLKPDNIFLHQSATGEVVKVVDFGIAKLVEPDHQFKLENLTATGTLVGTPLYMAPERILGHPYDGKSDLYSLGVMLFEMLTGRPPFVSDTNGTMGVFLGHLHKSCPSLRSFGVTVPSEVEEVILAAMAKNPEARPSAEKMSEVFGRYHFPAHRVEAMVSGFPTAPTGENESATTLAQPWEPLPSGEFQPTMGMGSEDQPETLILNPLPDPQV